MSKDVVNSRKMSKYIKYCYIMINIDGYCYNMSNIVIYCRIMFEFV